jgi:hypothetical protein
VPAPGKPVARPSFEAFFTAADGQGLADRTHRRFFSAGTVPPEQIVDASMTPAEITENALAGLPYPHPTFRRLELRKPGRQYVRSEGRHALAYERVPGRVRFFLDEKVYEDTARALLPEIGAYAAGLIDHIFRVAPTIQIVDGTARLAVEGEGIEALTVEVFAEDARGQRRRLDTPAARGPDAGGSLPALAIPPGTRRIAVAVQGRDRAGAFVAVAEAVVGS